MKLGIIGKPQCGKTTVFNAACGQQQAVGDYSRALHRAVIKVPDDRVDQLAELFQPKRITYAEIELLDAPGLTGKGKEAPAAEITPEVREMEALVLVIDAFSEKADPAFFIQNLIDEMILADQVIVEKSLETKKRRSRISNDAALLREVEVLARVLAALEAETPLIDLDLPPDQEKIVRGYQLLTLKPLLITLNIAEQDLPRADEIHAEHAHLITPGKRELVTLCGKVQMELSALSGEEQEEFREMMGVTALATDKLIQKSYALLGLVSFLTAGPKEVRAWTIRRGTTAQQAGGAVHSDIERGFIRAEVTRYEDLLEYKTPAALKAAGKTRLEGKQYIVKDGDEILFRFNV